MYIERALTAYWEKLSRQFPVLLLTGPRQVGKTTFLKHMAGPKRTYVSLDTPGVRELARNDPHLFLDRYRAPLVIDEIQYAPGLLEALKPVVDADAKDGAYWLTGSQPLHLIRDVSETLAGRIGIIRMTALSGRELRHDTTARPFVPDASLPAPDGTHGNEKTLFKAIRTGGMPALHAKRGMDMDAFFGSYVQTYVQRDIRDLTQVGDLDRFVRFVGCCAARTAQLLNMSDLARDCDISVPTAKQWLGLLTGCGLAYLLQPYHTNVTKRLVKTPKLYFMDTGLCAYLTAWTSPEVMAAGAMAGAFFETYVVTEILKSWLNAGRQPPLFFYRDRDGVEIDVLIAQDGTLYPVEIKKSATPRAAWIRHFKHVRKLQPPVGHGYAVCMCREPVPLNTDATALPAWRI